jgi:hypothetical protein
MARILETKVQTRSLASEAGAGSDAEHNCSGKKPKAHIVDVARQPGSAGRPAPRSRVGVRGAWLFSGLPLCHRPVWADG